MLIEHPISVLTNLKDQDKTDPLAITCFLDAVSELCQEQLYRCFLAKRLSCRHIAGGLIGGPLTTWSQSAGK